MVKELHLRRLNSPEESLWLASSGSERWALVQLDHMRFLLSAPRFELPEQHMDTTHPKPRVCGVQPNPRTPFIGSVLQATLDHKGL